MMRGLPDFGRLAMSGALAVMIAAAVALSEDEPDAERVVDVARKDRPSQDAALPGRRFYAEAPPALLALEPRRPGDDAVEVFRIERPPPASKTAAVSAAAPPPAAPPLPFKYLGRMDDGKGSLVLLSFQGQELAGRAGETIAGRYRLEAVDDAVIRFTYLPLGDEQVLTIGEKN